MLPGRMGRLLLVILAVLLLGCDESDPATSEHCVMIRMRVINARFWTAEAARNGSSPTEVASLEAGTQRLISANWQCFK